MTGGLTSLRLAGLAFASLVLVASAHGQNRNPLICEPVPGLSQLLDRYERAIIIAERSGTRELPATFGELACAFSARGPLVVGVEWLTDLQPWIDAYMASDGGEEARTMLVNILPSEPAANAPTYASIDMIERLRLLAKAGRDVRVLAWLIPELDEMPPPVEPIPTEGDNAFEIYDPDEDLTVPPREEAVTAHDIWRNNMREPATLEEAREAFMADMIQAVSDSRARFLLVASPERARQSPAMTNGVTHPSFAMTFPPGATYTLDVRHDRGEVWSCLEDGCRIRDVAGAARGGLRMVTQFPIVIDGFNGVIHLGPVSASPPARPPPPNIAFELYFDDDTDSDPDDAPASGERGQTDDEGVVLADSALLVRAAGP